MKIQDVTGDREIYTAKVYLVTGTWNAIDDVNTLIDVGRDTSTLQKIERASTGVGKRRVEQVILTHGHYDHSELLPAICEAYHPTVYAASPSLAGVDRRLAGGETIRCGDDWAEIIRVPVHSDDSVLIYFRSSETLFAGDTPLVIRSADATYGPEFLTIMRRLARLPIESIWFGHGDPVLTGGRQVIAQSLAVLESATALT